MLTVTAFGEIVARDVRLALHYSADSLMSIGFFLVVTVLFPLAIGPEPVLLERISAGVIWVTALLSTTLSLDRLFLPDYQDGSLDLTVLSPLPLPVVAIAKALAHWLMTGLPLSIIAPVVSVLLGIPKVGFWPLVLALLLGTPTLSLIGTVGAALALGARRGGLLIVLLVLPLDIPVLVFGVSAVEGAVTGMNTQAALMILGGLLLMALALTPWASAAALKQAVA